MMSAMYLPMTSSRRYPKVRSAAGLNSVMRPSWSIVTMQSSAESTIAAFRTSLRFLSLLLLMKFLFHQPPVGISFR